MDNSEIIIKKGWQNTEREEVAKLYDEAFGQKLAIAIPCESTRHEILADCFQPEYSLIALENNPLVFEVLLHRGSLHQEQ